MAAICVCQTSHDPDRANLRIVICDAFGYPLSGTRVTLTSIGPDGSFTSSGEEAKFNGVPYGLYDLEVRMPGFERRKEQIGIYQRDLAFRIGLRLLTTRAFQRPELSGSVKARTKASQALWVRLVALYSSDFVENRVDSSGKFEFDGMASGKYLLILFQEDKVLAIKPIDVFDNKQTIEIAPGPSAP